MYRKITALLLSCSIALSVAGCSVSGRAEPPDIAVSGLAVTALAFMSDLTGGHYSSACDSYEMTQQLKDVLSPSLLYLTMAGMTAENGRFEAIESVTEYNGSYYVGLQFKRQRATAVVSFEGDKLSGFVVTEWVDPASLLPAPERTLPEGAVETDVLFGDPQLPGKLVRPDGSSTVLILLSGSGPNDADSTIGPNKPLRDIAYDLAAMGISTLRFDKRSLVYGEQMAADTSFTPLQEYVEDAVAAYNYLAGHRDGYNRIFLAGHSMGGYMLPAIAGELPDAAGYIFLSANCSPIDRLAAMQLDYIESLDTTGSEQLGSLDIMRKQLAQLDTLSDDTPDDMVLFGAYPAYWRWLADYDPLGEAAKIEAPMLFIGGGRDYQVPPTELETWREALGNGGEKPAALFYSYPDLNHLLMTGEGPSTPDEYSIPGTVDQVVAAAIAEFINPVQ